VDTSELYQRFAATEARGESRCYERWAQGVAGDPELLRRIDALPDPKRQPNLIFAAARYHGLESGPFDGFRTYLLDHWAEIRDIVLVRRTQTNEAGRCAVLLPLLAALPQPLALVEVGTSAGLCLYPDRYSYRYGALPQLDPPDGPSKAVAVCATKGPVPVPDRLPEVVWRAGIDLNPLDVTNDDDVRWLSTLVWPEHDARRARLAAAIEIARADPPRLTAGDLNEQVAAVARQAPPSATLVIFHCSVLAYLKPPAWAAFIATVSALPGRWVSNEVPEILAGQPVPPPSEPDMLHNMLALDGTPVAYSRPHGQSLEWFRTLDSVPRR
jgi:hypothetical protein